MAYESVIKENSGWSTLLTLTSFQERANVLMLSKVPAWTDPKSIMILHAMDKIPTRPMFG